MSTSPVESGAEASAYAAAQVPGIESHKIAYFAASVFWRASLKQWKILGRTFDPIKLGPYQEAFRSYLNGDAEFPPNVCLNVILSHLEHPVLAWNYPDSIRIDWGYCHRLHIPGVSFMMAVGKVAAEQWRPICVVRSKSNLIYVARHGDALVQAELLALIGVTKTPRYSDNVVDGYEHLLPD